MGILGTEEHYTEVLKVQKKWVRIAILGLSFALIGLSLVGCRSGNNRRHAFNEKEVENAAAAVVELVNNNDGDALRKMSVTAVEQALTDEVLAQVFDAVNTMGEFKGIAEAEVTTVPGLTADNDLAVTVLTAQYAEGTITYTISFDTEMKLAGLYYK